MGDSKISWADDWQGASSAGVSTRIKEMLRSAPAEGVTIDWLLAHCSSRTPELLFLAFTPLAVVPATSTIAGVLLLVLAIPLTFDRRVPLPRFVSRQKISVVKIERSFNIMLAVVRGYETYAGRRSRVPAKHHSRLIGLLVTTLAATLVVPLPFSNVLPGLTIGTVALASLEEDNRLLILASLSTGVSLVLLVIEALSAHQLVTVLLK